MRRLTDTEILGLVRDVQDGRYRSMDEAAGHAIFEGKPPKESCDWPAEAWDTWSRCVNAWVQQALRDDGLPTPGKPWSRNDLTLPESWDAVVLVAPEPERWWEIPGVTWGVLAEALDVRPRVAAYRMRALGWAFRGRGLNVPNRRVVEAPCQVCGNPWTPPDIVRRRGPCCRVETSGSGADRAYLAQIPAA